MIMGVRGLMSRLGKIGDSIGFDHSKERVDLIVFIQVRILL